MVLLLRHSRASRRLNDSCITHVESRFGEMTFGALMVLLLPVLARLLRSNFARLKYVIRELVTISR